eukprot:gene11514-biopygen18400
MCASYRARCVHHTEQDVCIIPSKLCASYRARCVHRRGYLQIAAQRALRSAWRRAMQAGMQCCCAWMRMDDWNTPLHSEQGNSPGETWTEMPPKTIPFWAGSRFARGNATHLAPPRAG